MNLNDIEIPDTKVIFIRHPRTGEKLFDKNGENPVMITVFGPSSNQAIEYRRKVMRETTTKLGRKGIKGLGNLSPEELERQDVERLTALTAKVENLELNDVEITADSADLVYSNPKLGWLSDQVRDSLGSWDDFLA